MLIKRRYDFAYAIKKKWEKCYKNVETRREGKDDVGDSLQQHDKEK